MGTSCKQLEENKLNKFNFNQIFLICFLMIEVFYKPSLALGVEATSYYWYHDSERVELTLLPNHIIEFSSPEEGGGSVLGRALKPIKMKPLKGGGKLLKLSEDDFFEVLSENTDPAQKRINTFRSPLFKDSSGSVKAFAGGVLVKFKMGTSESTIKSLCNKNGLTLKRKYSVEGQEPLWMMSAPAGVASLLVANSLMENHSDVVVASRPNFWQPISTKELKGVPDIKNKKRNSKRR